MNFFKKLDISRKALQAIVFKRKILLAATFNITRRCNLQCVYCGVHEERIEELSTKDALSIIEELATLGTKIVKISGGEPLLREDLEDIIGFCKSKKMNVSINSNGTLIKREFLKVRKADEIQLSLDGPQDINDAIRGEGVYDKVIEAIEISKKNNIHVILTTVISKYNIFHVPYILDIAKKYQVGVYFQPVDQKGN